LRPSLYAVMKTLEKQIYRFSDVEVDTLRGCLRRGDEEKHLRRKSFQVLAYLLEHRGRLVTKDELFELIWADTAVGDDALVQCIREIRQAIGDDSHHPRFIKTISRSGYRFIGSVEQKNDDFPNAETAAPLQEVPSPLFPISKSLRKRVVLVAVLICATVIFSFGLLVKKSWRAEYQPPEILLPQTPGKKSIAVMYFENRSSSTELGWLREGIADMLITNLSRSAKINVLSRQQFHSLLEKTDVHPNDEISFEQAVRIARTSQATNFINGSFARAGEKIRIDAQLYDSQNGSLLSAESLIVEKPEQILTGIDLLSLKLVNRLGVSANDQDNLTGFTKTMTDNLEAYRNYSLAVEKAQALQNKEAIALLEKAVALDPQFAMAHARIGYAYSITWGRVEKGKSYLEKAFKLSERLTEKDRLNINAWYAIANLDYSTAIQSYREIIEKYPLETESYWRLGWLLSGEERTEEAITVLKQGLSVDSENKNIYNALGSILSKLGRHDEAIAAHQHYVEIAPEEANAYDSLGLSYEWAGGYEAAIANYNRALELNPNFEIALVHLANTRFQMGQYREAISLYHRYIKIAPSYFERARGLSAVATLYHKKKDFVSAERAANEAVKNDSSARLGWVLYRLAVERSDLARAKKFENIIFGSKSSTITDRGARLNQRLDFYYHGFRALKNGNADEAIAQFKEALKRQPPIWNIEAFEDCLAEAYLELGNYEEAIAEYRRILRLNPNYPFARFYLAQAYQRKGMLEEARENFRQFLHTWKDADADIPEIIIAKKFIAET
jgi:tetratricopeptide (TPR) repeat protein/DNA-binding winged helix-turn-helix (wHTH) protein